MDGRSSFGFWESLRTNVSLYFPFLAYYHISYYASPLFPLQEMARLGAANPDDLSSLQPGVGLESKIGLLTIRALVAAAAAAVDARNLAPGGLIATWMSDETWMQVDWAAVLSSGWPLFGALALLQESLWDTSIQLACSPKARQFGSQLQQAITVDEPVTLDKSLGFLASMPEIAADEDKLCSATVAASNYETLRSELLRRWRWLIGRELWDPHGTWSRSFNMLKSCYSLAWRLWATAVPISEQRGGASEHWPLCQVVSSCSGCWTDCSVARKLTSQCAAGRPSLALRTQA